MLSTSSSQVQPQSFFSETHTSLTYFLFQTPGGYMYSLQLHMHSKDAGGTVSVQYGEFGVSGGSKTSLTQSTKLLSCNV